MGRVVLKSRDLNRYRKTYPGVRWAARGVYTTEEPFALESATVNFSGGSSATYVFENSYESVPNVVATSLDESFNVFVLSISTTQVVVGASAANNSSASVVVVST
jgi:hypothetical protein